MSNRLTIKVPATSANIGPGFDCLGLAFDIWSTFHFSPGKSCFTIIGEGQDLLSNGKTNLVSKGFRIPFEKSGNEIPDISVTCINKIPIERGLGSSSAAIIAGLLAGNEFSGKNFTTEEILQFAAEIEGHPDNVAAALLGGCQLVVLDDDRWITSPVTIHDETRFVAFIPNFPMSTDQARSIIPEMISTKDAVYNLGRLGLLVNGLGSDCFPHIRIATEDRIHQPARLSLFPEMKNIFRGAINAGALGVFLSGAGSTVIAITRGKETTIGYEMAEAASKSGIQGNVQITRSTKQGAQISTGD